MRGGSVQDPAEVALATRTAARLWPLVAILGVIGVLWGTQQLLAAHYERIAAEEAGQHARIFRSALQIELQEGWQLAPLLASDDRIRAGLSGAAGAARDRLAEVRELTGIAGLALIDRDGRVLVAADPSFSVVEGEMIPFVSGLVAASGDDDAIFATPHSGVPLDLYLSRQMRGPDGAEGMVLARIRLGTIAESWSASAGQILVTDARGRLVTSSLGTGAAEIARRVLALKPAGDGWLDRQPSIRLDGSAHLATSVEVGSLGLVLHYLAPLGPAHSRVYTGLALEALVLALLVAGVFWIGSRRARRAWRAEAANVSMLKRYNERLTTEIEERRRIEDELRRAQDELSRASRLAALGQMSAAVSHELNQPLAAMRTYLAGARLLARRGRAEEAEESLDRIDALIGRMGSITRQLKSFARTNETEARNFDLREAARGAFAIIRAAEVEAGIDMRIELGGMPVMVRGEQMRVEQILLNLLQNAVDATRSQKIRRVALRVWAARGHARAVVEDTGTGLPPDPDRLFEPFVTTKKPGEGMGLGLAISSAIAGEMGGSLTAGRGPHRGARFVLDLPLAGSQTRAAE